MLWWVLLVVWTVVSLELLVIITALDHVESFKFEDHHVAFIALVCAPGTAVGIIVGLICLVGEQVVKLFRKQ